MAKKIVAPPPAPTPGPADTEPIIYSLHAHLHGRTVGSSFGDMIIDRHGFLVNFYTLRAKMAVTPVTPEQFLARANGFIDARAYRSDLVTLWDATREERDTARVARDAMVKKAVAVVVPNSAPGRVVTIDPMTGKAVDQEFVGRVRDLTGTELPSQTPMSGNPAGRKPTLTDDTHEPLILSGVATERAKAKLEEANRMAKLVAAGTATPSGADPVATTAAATAASPVSVQEQQIQVVREMVEREPESLGPDGQPSTLKVQGALLRAQLPPLAPDQIRDIMKAITAGTP